MFCRYNPHYVEVISFGGTYIDPKHVQHRVEGVKNIVRLLRLIDGIELDSKRGHAQGVKRTTPRPIKHVDLSSSTRVLEASLAQGIPCL